MPLAVPLFLRGCDRNGREFLDFTTALNVSAGGALVAARRPLRPSTRLSLEIPSSPLPRLSLSPGTVNSLKAKIVRTTNKDTYHLYALRFNRPLL
ncbi:MAG: PilZ domain-containing protein [Acidobacteria bacterium]|nr:PilZ domain-containing protein [Acidobacteriota bacterium]